MSCGIGRDKLDSADLLERVILVEVVCDVDVTEEVLGGLVQFTGRVSKPFRDSRVDKREVWMLDELFSKEPSLRRSAPISRRREERALSVNLRQLTQYQ